TSRCTSAGSIPGRTAASGPLGAAAAWGTLAGCGAQPIGAASIATTTATAATHRIVYLPPLPAAPRLIRDAHPTVDYARRRGRDAGALSPGSVRRAACSRARA